MTWDDNNFINNEAGAVSVDWIVLTACLIVLGMATTVAVNDQLEGMADEISTHLASTEIS
jgi:Flp pilus assembly pilin Flp